MDHREYKSGRIMTLSPNIICFFLPFLPCSLPISAMFGWSFVNAVCLVKIKPLVRWRSFFPLSSFHSPCPRQEKREEKYRRLEREKREKVLEECTKKTLWKEPPDTRNGFYHTVLAFPSCPFHFSHLYIWFPSSFHSSRPSPSQKSGPPDIWFPPEVNKKLIFF
jgi:hypothetical protein